MFIMLRKLKITTNNRHIAGIDCYMDSTNNKVNVAYDFEILNTFLNFNFLSFVEFIVFDFNFDFFDIRLNEAPQKCDLHDQNHSIENPNRILTHLLLYLSCMTYSSLIVFKLLLGHNDVTLNTSNENTTADETNYEYCF